MGEHRLSKFFNIIRYDEIPALHGNPGSRQLEKGREPRGLTPHNHLVLVAATRSTMER